jgi:hypothetical protein
MSRLALAAITVTLALTGCTRRQQDFAWFAAEVAIAVAQTSSQVQSEAEPPPNPDTYAGPSQADLARAHDVASELTMIAERDAREDRCDAVVRTSHHVRVIDPDVFANVFLKDPPIQRCLAITP